MTAVTSANLDSGFAGGSFYLDNMGCRDGVFAVVILSCSVDITLAFDHYFSIRFLLCHSCARDDLSGSYDSDEVGKVRFIAARLNIRSGVDRCGNVRRSGSERFEFRGAEPSGVATVLSE